MRFASKAELETLGYSQYRPLFENSEAAEIPFIATGWQRALMSNPPLIRRTARRQASISLQEAAGTSGRILTFNMPCPLG